MASCVQSMFRSGEGGSVMHPGDVRIISWGLATVIEGSDLIPGSTNTTVALPNSGPARALAITYVLVTNGDHITVRWDLLKNGISVASATAFVATFIGTVQLTSGLLSAASTPNGVDNIGVVGDTWSVQVTFVSGSGSTPTVEIGNPRSETWGFFSVEQWNCTSIDTAQCDELLALVHHSINWTLDSYVSSTASLNYSTAISGDYSAYDLDVNSLGHTLITEIHLTGGLHDRIEAFDNTGVSLGQFGPNLDTLGFTHDGVSIRVFTNDHVYLLGWNSSTNDVLLVHLDSTGTLVSSYTNLEYDLPCSFGTPWDVGSELFFDITNDLKVLYTCYGIGIFNGSAQAQIYRYDLNTSTNLGLVIDLSDQCGDRGYGTASYAARTAGALRLLLSENTIAIVNTHPIVGNVSNVNSSIWMIEQRIDLIPCDGISPRGYIPLDVPIYNSNSSPSPKPPTPKLLTYSETTAKLWSAGNHVLSGGVPTYGSVEKYDIGSLVASDTINPGHEIHRIASCELRHGDFFCAEIMSRFMPYVTLIGAT